AALLSREGVIVLPRKATMGCRYAAIFHRSRKLQARDGLSGKRDSVMISAFQWDQSSQRHGRAFRCGDLPHLTRAFCRIAALARAGAPFASRPRRYGGRPRSPPESAASPRPAVRSSRELPHGGRTRARTRPACRRSGSAPVRLLVLASV